MVKFTFLEIHVDDSDFTATASAPYEFGEKDVEAGEEIPDREDGSKTGAALAAVVGLVFLVAVAYVAKRRFLDDDDEEFDEEFDVEV
ncbi:hypothetical protein [Natronomonas marina]|jgi:hypothetical protein|uniref:hypothetical protein n=1 Tax=Natronomonas marina TaxID=2961939 RepID=UPI0020C989DB|nr:hypothetical protein [Natronomonas marina]